MIRIEMKPIGDYVKAFIEFVGIVVSWRTINAKLKTNDWMFQQFQEILGRRNKEIEELIKHDEREIIGKAIEFLLEWGEIEGDHHRAWVVDQVLRILVDDKMQYEYYVATRSGWEEGIPP